MLRYENFFQVLTDGREQADAWEKKAEQMIWLRDHIEEHNWPLSDAAESLCVSEEWVENLLAGRFDLIEGVRDVCDRLAGLDAAPV